MINIMEGNNEQATNEILQKIKRKLEQYPNKTEIDKQITHTNPNTTNIIQTKKTSEQTNRNQYQQQYEQLLKNKVTDQNVKNKIIEFAELIMQPTTKCQLYLQDQGETVAELEIVVCLPEHTQDYANFWIGQTIDSPPEFLHQVRRFQRQMQIKNIGATRIVQTPSKKTTITSITAIYTYR